MKGRQDASPAKDTGRFSTQLNNCQKIAGKKGEKMGQRKILSPHLQQ
jgi:hypothetical protein